MLGCQLLIEGRATVEARKQGAGSFVGLIDADGRPPPLSGRTVRLATHPRVLVIAARRLAVPIEPIPRRPGARCPIKRGPPIPGLGPLWTCRARNHRR